jgi:hypothetical protein
MKKLVLNLQDRHPDEVRRLRARIETWTETIPAEPNKDCFSRQREQ